MKRARGWAWGAIGSLMALGGATYVSACVGDEPATFGGDQDGGGDGIAPGAVACKTTTDCTGGGSCVDGFCCDTSCDGQCQACDVSGHEGTCTAVTGKPHHEACTGDPSGACAGTCDGTNTDSCSYPDVACGTAGSCAGGTAQTAQTCSKGTCGASTSHACGLGCFQDSCLGVAQVAVGFSTTCVLLTDTSVRCWGDNTSGVTGQSMGTTITTPQIVGGLTSVKMLGASGSTMCALMGDGTVKCWGSNYYGQLGNGNNYETTTANPVPSTVSGVTGATFISSTTGQRFCAIVAGGGVKCWGFNQNGSLGYGKTEAAMGHTNQPQDVCAPGATTAPCTSLLTGATYVAGGDYHTCAVVGGKVACWGTSQNGVLGTPNDGVDHPIPAFVPGITDAATLTGSGYISCAA
ncbi:MAG TPA: hypothetical protein VF407_06900, partial [Polyangiaceae bacterium]